MSEQATRIADALGAAISARDADAIRQLYADDIVVWHGSTGQAQSKAENAGLLAALFGITSALEYRGVSRHVIVDGLVQQHTLTGTFADGKPMPDLRCCLILKVRDGQIIKLDEYFDGSTYAEVWERLAGASG